MKDFFTYQIFFILLLGSVCFAQQGKVRRLIPIAYKSCDPKGNLDFPAKNLWDGKSDASHKWCCFHAGYKVPQTHWVIMDLGNSYPISRIVIHHEGDIKKQPHLLTEDFRFFGSNTSMEGPWFEISAIKDNQKQINTITLPNIRVRYLGLEVTDPQLGKGANKTQDDWAVRITELYIYTPEKGISSNPFPVNQVRSPFDINTPLLPSHIPTSKNSTLKIIFDQVNNNKTYKTGKKLYYFNNPNIVKCKNLEKFFATTQVKQALLPYHVKAVDYDSEKSLFTQYSVFIVPTLIITDARGKLVKRTSTEMNQKELINFLK